jgi:hypothetical protein
MGFIVPVRTDHGSACLVAVVEIINLQKEVVAFHSGGLFLTNDDLELNSIVNRVEFL